MVTEAWVQSDRHLATVHSAQPSGVSARDPRPSERVGRGSFHDNNRLALISCNFPGEHSCSKKLKGRICNSKVVFSSLVNKYEYKNIQVDDYTNESADFQAARESPLMLTKHNHVSSEDSDMKRGVNSFKPNEIATGTKTEMTSRPNTKDAASDEHLTNANPQNVDASEEPLFLEVLRGITPSTSTSRLGEGSYKQGKDKDAKSLMCGDLSSVTDMQGNPWDANAGTEFTKSAMYKTPEKLQFSKGVTDVMRSRSNKSQNNKSQAQPSYSERYGIDSKCFPTTKKRSGNIGVQQHSAQNRPLSVSGKVNHRMTATAGVTSNREASLARRASVMNITLQCHNKEPHNKVMDDDASLTLDAQARLPVMKGREPKRPLTDDFVLDQPLTWKGCSNVQVDDVNNNREHKFHNGDTPWVTHEPVAKDCTRGNTIILSATPGANSNQGRGGKDHSDPVGSHDHESDLLVIKRFASQATTTNADLAMSHWSSVKYAILCGQHMDISTSGLTDESVDGSASAKLHPMDTPKVRRPAPPKTVFRKLDKPQQTDAKNASTEGDGEPHAATTSLIEDPILVKVSKRNRNVGKFTCQPDPLPNAVCFEISGTGLRHQDVKLQVESLLQKFPEVKIIGIQFHNRALVNNQREMNNRWIITTNTSEGCKLLVGCNLIFDGCEVQLRLYDEVISTEYQQFVRMTNFVKMMDTRKILS